MKFILIDNIIEIKSGEMIKTVKSVSLAEEYLGDHFPKFPVLPGVLLLQGMIESASWLVREKNDFSKSMILLDNTKNVKYKSFASPGKQIQYTVQAKSIEQDQSSFKARGDCQDEPIVEARIQLRHFNLADDNPKMESVDKNIIKQLRQRWKLLTQ